MGDRPAAGLRTLTPSTQVRILVSQPSYFKGLADFGCPFFAGKWRIVPEIAAKLGEYKKLQVTTNLKEFNIYFS